MPLQEEEEEGNYRRSEAASSRGRSIVCIVFIDITIQLCMLYSSTAVRVTSRGVSEGKPQLPAAAAKNARRLCKTRPFCVRM